jgi:hypothetical protein
MIHPMTRRPSRRVFLAAVGAASVGLAGCSDDDGNGADNNPETGDDDPETDEFGQDEDCPLPVFSDEYLGFKVGRPDGWEIEYLQPIIMLWPPDSETTLALVAPFRLPEQVEESLTPVEEIPVDEEIEFTSPDGSGWVVIDPETGDPLAPPDDTGVDSTGIDSHGVAVQGAPLIDQDYNLIIDPYTGQVLWGNDEYGLVWIYEPITGEPVYFIREPVTESPYDIYHPATGEHIARPLTDENEFYASAEVWDTDIPDEFSVDVDERFIGHDTPTEVEEQQFQEAFELFLEELLAVVAELGWEVEADSDGAIQGHIIYDDTTIPIEGQFEWSSVGTDIVIWGGWAAEDEWPDQQETILDIGRCFEWGPGRPLQVYTYEATGFTGVTTWLYAVPDGWTIWMADEHGISILGEPQSDGMWNAYVGFQFAINEIEYTAGDYLSDRIDHMEAFGYELEDIEVYDFGTIEMPDVPPWSKIAIKYEYHDPVTDIRYHTVESAASMIGADPFELQYPIMAWVRQTPTAEWDHLNAISAIIEASIVIEDLAFWEFDGSGMVGGNTGHDVQLLQDGWDSWEYGGYGDTTSWGGDIGIGYDLSTPAVGFSSGNPSTDIINETFETRTASMDTIMDTYSSTYLGGHQMCYDPLYGVDMMYPATNHNPWSPTGWMGWDDYAGEPYVIYPIY